MNIRAVVSLVSLVMAFATTSNAVEHAVIGSSSVNVASGETFTINVSIDNAGTTPVTGLTGVISGLNSVGGTVVAGQATLLNFASVCADFGGGLQCFGALNTLTNANYDPTDLSAAALGGVAAYSPGDDFVNTLAALHGPGTSSNGTGAADPGVPGILGTFNATDISIDLTATTSGTIAVELAFTEDGVMATTDLTPLMITITVPEPGAVASSAVALSTILAVVGIRRREV